MAQQPRRLIAGGLGRDGPAGRRDPVDEKNFANLILV